MLLLVVFSACGRIHTVRVCQFWQPTFPSNGLGHLGKGWIVVAPPLLSVLFIMNTFYKLPQQKGLLFMQSDLATELFSIRIAKQAERRDCKNLRLRVCPSCYNCVRLNADTVKTYGWESVLSSWNRNNSARQNRLHKQNIFLSGKLKKRVHNKKNW